MSYNKLSPEEERVMVHKGTKPPFTGENDNFYEQGTYICWRCNQPLFSSKNEFDAGCGWPSFDESLPNAIKHVEEEQKGSVQNAAPIREMNLSENIWRSRTLEIMLTHYQNVLFPQRPWIITRWVLQCLPLDVSSFLRQYSVDSRASNLFWPAIPEEKWKIHPMRRYAPEGQVMWRLLK